MTFRVYRYGLRPPIENAKLVRDQFVLAHKYQNRLIEIEIQQRAEVRALSARHGVIPELEANARVAVENVERLLSEIKALKSASKTRAVPQDLKDQLASAKAVKKETRSALQTARYETRADAAIAAINKEIQEKYLVARKAARASNGLYWGSYLLVEDADDARRKMPFYKGIEPNDPRFVRWSGNGAVGVQMQQGLHVESISTSRHIRIDPRQAPPGADPTSKRSAKRSYCTLRMRVGTNDDATKSPVWAAWPMVYHRPLPEGGVIKRAAVHLNRIGPREEWYLLISVDFSGAAVTPTTSERVAVDIGWRVTEDEGICVATCVSDSGETTRLTLDKKLLSQAKKAEELQSTRKKNFNEIIAALVSQIYLATNASPPTMTLPEWFPTNLTQWKSEQRLSGLIRQWAKERFDGDEEIFTAAEAWRVQDHHLWDWECNQRTKALRHRREVYRIFASKLSKKYTGIVLEDFDLRKVAQVPSVEDQVGDNEQARANRHSASVSELRLCLVNKFVDRVSIVPAEFTTKRCAHCGHLNIWDQAKYVNHTCGSCGTTWNQDENAARNLLAYESPPVEAKAPSKGRWIKAKEAKKEREAAE